MTVIDLKKVSKRFLIHRKQQLAADRARSSRSTLEDFWALRDVTFQVKAGENVALVGGNGAGKSTLLGIIAGVIAATSGEVHKVGRLGALLELGTGFHPDLTGRENIHLNASLLGFRRKDVEREFDAIVDFAELLEFIDEPVRTYSSGMVARLGFSVAVHIDPDILIMDEVLSVGDKGFQQKCQKRIHNLAGQGKTLLFVSHQLAAVEAMCPRTVWLERGRVRLDGPTEEVLPLYEAAMTKLPQRRDSVEVVRARSVGADEAD